MAPPMQPPIRGYLKRTFTPKRAGSVIPKRTEIKLGMQSSWVLASLLFFIRYPRTAPPWAVMATDIRGFKIFRPVSARSCASMAPKIW